MSRPFRFGVVAPVLTDLPTWRDRVRRIADSGYSTLLMADVPAMAACARPYARDCRGPDGPARRHLGLRLPTAPRLEHRMGGALDVAAH